MRKGVKRFLIISVVILAILLLLTVGGSYYIGLQVFEGSTQLVSPEDTKEVKDSFWTTMNMDPEEFKASYAIENISETSTFDGHIIPEMNMIN